MNLRKIISCEIEKNSLKKYIVGSVIIILMICFFMIVAMDSVMHETPITRMTYDSMISSIGSFIMEAFIIWDSVLIAKIIVEEYTNKTILIAFTYPIKKNKLIMAKMSLVVLFGVASTIIGDIVSVIFITIIDKYFNMLEGEFVFRNFISSIQNIMVGCFAVIFFSLIPYTLGIYKKSISITIISGFVAAFIVQVFASQSPGPFELLLCILATSIVIVVCAVRVSKKYIKNIDDL